MIGLKYHFANISDFIKSFDTLADDFFLLKLITAEPNRFLFLMFVRILYKIISYISIFNICLNVWSIIINKLMKRSLQISFTIFCSNLSSLRTHNLYNKSQKLLFYDSMMITTILFISPCSYIIRLAVFLSI